MQKVWSESPEGEASNRYWQTSASSGNANVSSLNSQAIQKSFIQLKTDLPPKSILHNLPAEACKQLESIT